jgi:predicted nucleotidyltransferase component of viral defense system
MLQTATVHPATLAILKKVMQMPEIQQFNLVGGTSLSLQIGHRISVDLDLFTYQDYDSSKIIQALQPLGDLDILVDNPPFLQSRLDDVKLDFLKFSYPFVQDYIEIDGVRLVSIENIAIMKLLAIARRSVKKDFIDLYFMLERYRLEEIVQVFETKLPHVDMFHILKSLTYFGDAESDGDPKMLIKAPWKNVKKVIVQKVNAYLKTR